jgi:hypothetical protein
MLMTQPPGYSKAVTISKTGMMKRSMMKRRTLLQAMLAGSI